MMSEALEWIDKESRTGRVWMWRGWEGHYEATEPRDGTDVAVMYRDDFSESGTVLGAHPELGQIHAANGEPATTRIFPRVERGAWVKLDTP